jgi:hypothetical protein
MLERAAARHTRFPQRCLPRLDTPSTGQGGKTVKGYGVHYTTKLLNIDLPLFAFCLQSLRLVLRVGVEVWLLSD